MSISQHIAGIRSRTGQNRVSTSEQVHEESQVQNEEPTGLERSSQSYEDDLANKLHCADIDNSKSLPTLSFASLEEIDFAKDVDDRLQQANVLDRLEQRWHDLNSNLEATLNHLQDCSYQVSLLSRFRIIISVIRSQILLTNDDLLTQSRLIIIRLQSLLWPAWTRSRARLRLHVIKLMAN